MKSILTALFLITVVTPTARAASETWVISNSIDIIARQIHSTIPGVSFDHLFEAKREKDGWSYVYWNNYGKIWVDEIHIRLTYLAAKETRIQVEAYRKESGIFFGHKEQKPELLQKTCTWLKTIK